MTHDNMIFIPASMAHADTEAPIIAVQAGEQGYWPIYHPSHEELNKRPASEEVLRSALQASMFGWHAPCARAAIEWLFEKNNAPTA